MGLNLYTGKLFTLKNVSRISWSSKNTPNRYSRTERRGEILREDVGDTVMVLEERAKRVKIMTKKHGLIWIAKYYLRAELVHDLNNKEAIESAEACISSLVSIANEPGADSGLTTQLYEIITALQKIKGALES